MDEDQKKQMLERVRHELVTLHGLVAADGSAPNETWVVDTSAAIADIDSLLSAHE